jgi:hypothetical protein
MPKRNTAATHALKKLTKQNNTSNILGKLRKVYLKTSYNYKVTIKDHRKSHMHQLTNRLIAIK